MKEARISGVDEPASQGKALGWIPNLSNFKMV